MSATSLTLARAIPPSLPLRNRLPTRPPQPFLSIRRHGTTPFHRTPTLHAWSRSKHFAKKAAAADGTTKPARFDSLVPKRDRPGLRNGTRPTNPFPKNQWTGPQNSEGYAFKKLELKSDIKAGLEVEDASEVHDEEPAVIDWGGLSEAPLEPVEGASEVDDGEGLYSKDRLDKVQSERELRSAARKQKKIERLMISLEKMNSATEDFKNAKKGKVLYDLAAVDPEAASLPPPELPTYDEALVSIKSMVELKPNASQREKKISEYLRHWDKHRPNLKAPTVEEHAKLYKEEYLRMQAKLEITPGSSVSKETQGRLEAHMRAWNLVNRPGEDDAADAPREPRDERRHKKLYARELESFRKKLGVESGSDEHKERIELHMQRWEAKRLAQVEKVVKMRETKTERKAAKLAAQKERKKAKMEAKHERKKISDEKRAKRQFDGDPFVKKFSQGLFIKTPSP